MKNKKLTYFLIFAVLIVWGLILYRVFDVSKDNDDDAPAPNTKPVKEAYNDYAIPKDTTRLLLNYRDPFGLIPLKDTTTRTKQQAKTLNPDKPKPAINWNFIQYAGYIRNPSSKKLVALLTINGKNEMLTEGETRDQVKLIKNLRDSIKIGFNGKTKFILIHSVTL